jgi:hypothetical protein
VPQLRTTMGNRTLDVTPQENDDTTSGSAQEEPNDQEENLTVCQSVRPRCASVDLLTDCTARRKSSRGRILASRDLKPPKIPDYVQYITELLL